MRIPRPQNGSLGINIIAMATKVIVQPPSKISAARPPAFIVCRMCNPQTGTMARADRLLQARARMGGALGECEPSQRPKRVRPAPQLGPGPKLPEILGVRGVPGGPRQVPCRE